MGDERLHARIAEFLVIVLIGDGRVGLLQPRRHSRLWRSGPAPYRAAIDAFLRKPGITRLLSVGQAAVGVWLASRQRPA